MLNQNYTYLFINFLIIIFPLLFTFDKRVKYYLKIKYVFFTILVVSTPFIVWDIFFTKTKVWEFNENYITNFKIINLPVEEILFFITIPYSLLFIYEVLLYYNKKEKNKIEKIKSKKSNEIDNFKNKKRISFFDNFYNFLKIFFISLSIIFSPIFYNKIYASLIFLLTFLSLILLKKFLNDKIFILYNLIGLFLFFIFNYFLTSIPVVIYYDKIIFRILTIPIEDFFYNFVLLNSYLKIYIYFKNI